MENIEIISVHYKTPEYIYEQYESVRNFYPNINYRVIDGSDNGERYFEDLEKKDVNFVTERFGYNIHHGPGMDYGIKTSNKDYLLIIDSDVTLIKPIIEDMIKEFKGYSVGKLLTLNSSGYEKTQKNYKGDNNFIYSYIHPYCMLINRNSYLEFKPFIKHGAPCIESMIDIYNKNKINLLSNFNIENYVNLRIRGTCSKWGYNL
jgi:GT2 family glycosyltransferase